MPLALFNTSPVDYPYDDDLNFAVEEGFLKHGFSIALGGSNHRYAGSYAVKFYDDFEIYYDPEGDNESAWANIERPEETEVSRIEMPAGCQHLVYWGKRVWTKWTDGFGGNYLDFSAKMWSDADAAELQRSEAVFWWFRSVHAGGPIDLSKLRFRSFMYGDEV